MTHRSQLRDKNRKRRMRRTEYRRELEKVYKADQAASVALVQPVMLEGK